MKINQDLLEQYCGANGHDVKHVTISDGMKKDYIPLSLAFHGAAGILQVSFASAELGFGHIFKCDGDDLTAFLDIKNDYVKSESLLTGMVHQVKLKGAFDRSALDQILDTEELVRRIEAVQDIVSDNTSDGLFVRRANKDLLNFFNLDQ